MDVAPDNPGPPRPVLPADIAAKAEQVGVLKAIGEAILVGLVYWFVSLRPARLAAR